jgi:16S rRNA (adenine1518-N6/adenine1519-N6)-dimethyltransferase
VYDRERRRFGQNFLVDSEVCRQISFDVDPRPEGTVIEIGPGAGAITELLGAAGRLVVVEIDPRWAEKIPKRVPPGTNLVVLNQDALLTDLSPYFAPAPGDLPPVLCGNLPYNRATSILNRFLPSIGNFRHMVFMVQYEVAKRICAESGSRDYGSLSVFIRNWAIPEPLQKIGPDSFRPRPRVHSATFRLTPREAPMETDPLYGWFVRACFKQKRKTLRNCLLMILPAEAVDRGLAKAGLATGVRGEEVSPEGFVHLFRAFSPELDALRASIDISAPVEIED